MSEAAKIGALIVRVGAELMHLPGDEVVAVAQEPVLRRVAGAPPELLGVAVHDGEPVPVAGVGPDRGTMIVCSHGAERIGLVGAHVVDVGLFEAGPGASVMVGSEAAPRLDLERLVTRLREGAERWRG